MKKYRLNPYGWIYTEPPKRPFTSVIKLSYLHRTNPALANNKALYLFASFNFFILVSIFPRFFLNKIIGIQCSLLLNGGIASLIEQPV
ncbi:hypothetical protein HZS_3667 [Henneguya salminicola]|nr:hypothetical protein HZS_3667 [Henneguya salminicola]